MSSACTCHFGLVDNCPDHGMAVQPSSYVTPPRDELAILKQVNRELRGELDECMQQLREMRIEMRALRNLPVERPKTQKTYGIFGVCDSLDEW